MIAPWHRPPFNGDLKAYHAHLDATRYEWTEERLKQAENDYRAMLEGVFEHRARMVKSGIIQPDPVRRRRR